MISDTKASKITQKHLFYNAFTIRDAEVAGSSPVTPTISSVIMDFVMTLDFYLSGLLVQKSEKYIKLYILIMISG